MGRYDFGRYGGWAPYVPVGRKISLGTAAAKKLAAKEKRQPCPVMVTGTKIAKTFWGLQWCGNLERYQDFANRLPRGRTYLRNGSVADLVIEPGQIRSLVAGSKPYRIEIQIKTLPPAVWKSILQDCAQEVDSLLDLLQGKFSDGVMKRLTRPDGGLFPRPTEITMRCSCPDYAGVCKHIAATFYGVGARLDQQPELLFKLRRVNHLDLIGQATTAANLERAFSGDDSTTLADDDLSGIFGIELDAADDAAADQPALKSRKVGKRKADTPAANTRKTEEPPATVKATRVKKKAAAAITVGRSVRPKAKPASRSTAKVATRPKSVAKKTPLKKQAAERKVAKKASAAPVINIFVPAVSEQDFNKKPVSKKAVSKKAVSKKAVSKKAVSKKAISKKAISKKAVSKKAVSKKAVSKKAVTRKAVAPQK